MVDKTGTLTLGKPRLVDLIVEGGIAEADALQLVASLERASEHPLAQAIVGAAEERGVALKPVEQFEAVTGQGVRGTVGGHAVAVGNRRFMEAFGGVPQALAARADALRAQGKTAMYAAIDHRVVAVLAVADPIKEAAAEAIGALQAQGVSVVMLSGDSRATAEAVARQLGIKEVIAEVLPEQKVETIKSLQDRGRVVAMAGDGVNDAPALAQADVGIAMGTGTDVAIESATVTLVKGDLRGIVKAIRAFARHNAKCEAEPVLCLRLQRPWSTDCGGRALSVLRYPAVPHFCWCRDGHELRFGCDERAAAAPGEALAAGTGPKSPNETKNWMRILIVDDDVKTSEYLRQGLTENGFVVDTARDGLDGTHLALTGSYDLVILDVMLPGRDGWKVVGELRKEKETPVLFLTARDRVEDRVRGLELGADDYLVKPFAFSELLARVRTVLKRGQARDPELLRVADLELDPVRRRVQRASERIDLTTKEFALLHLFLRRAGQVLSRTAIAEQVWDMHFDSDTNVVDVAVRRLRAKVDDPFQKKLIHTVRGAGYVLDER